MVASIAALHGCGSDRIQWSSSRRGGNRTLGVNPAAAVLHAVADLPLVNIQADVIHRMHGGASLVSLNQRLLSAVYLHQALLLRPIHSNLPGGWKESEDSQIPIDQFTSSNSAVQAVRLKVRQKWKIVADLISSIVL